MYLALYLFVCSLVSVIFVDAYKAGASGGAIRTGCGKSGRSVCKPRPHCPLGDESVPLSQELPGQVTKPLNKQPQAPSEQIKPVKKSSVSSKDRSDSSDCSSESEESTSKLPESTRKPSKPTSKLPQTTSTVTESTSTVTESTSKLTESTIRLPDLETDHTYTGVLTKNCLRTIHYWYVTRQPLPRNYSYWHEIPRPPKQNGTYCDRSKGYGISGGKEVCITEVPYIVMYGRGCGGTLIAPEWVLTAAHCRKQKYVFAGSTTRDLAHRYRICAHFIHPKYELDKSEKEHEYDYDYQLVLLEHPVPVTPYSVPVAIGTLADMTLFTRVSVCGWGSVNNEQVQMQNAIRRIYLLIVDSETCRIRLGNIYPITPRMFCLGYKNYNLNTCKGDSGGPAVANYKLIGLVSFIDGCGQPNRPGVYAHVPAVRAWIRSITTLRL